MERDGSFIKISPKNREPILKIKERRIVLPIIYLKFFKKEFVELLFDPEKNLIGLRPSSNPFDFKLCTWNSKVRNVIYCQRFLKFYSIPPQQIEVTWDKKKRMLIGKVKRDE